MQNYHIRCKAPEADVYGLFGNVKENSLHQNQHQIDIKKPVFKPEHAHIGHHDLCIVVISHKCKKNYNKNKVNAHHEKRANGKAFYVAGQRRIGVDLV